MNGRIIAVALAAAVFGAVVGILGFVWLVGGSGEPSGTISAPTLDVNAVATMNPTQAFAAATQVAELETQVSELEATIAAQSTNIAAQNTSIAAQNTSIAVQNTSIAVQDTAAQEAAIEPTAAMPTPTPTETAVSETVMSGRLLYRIDSASSEVSFTLQEDLQGVRTTVVGTTNEVAGDIIIDFDNPAASQIGTIRINARTLATNNEIRNRAIRSRILRSAEDAYEFIDFVPTAINGIPTAIVIGETYTLEIVGNLTLVGQTHEVTFTAQVTLESETQLNGSASTVINYTEWGIAIPSAPGVANVTPEVTLSIDFVALQVES
jgi:polyisoprenoid-binding protein YceI